MSKNILQGVDELQRAIGQGLELETVFIQKGNKSKRLLDLEEELRALGYPVKRVPLFKLDKLVRGRHDGIIALRSLIEYQDTANLLSDLFEKGHTPALLALDRVTDVRNFGAIARSAEAMGIDALLLPKYERALVNAVSMEISTNALQYLKVTREDSLSESLRLLQNSGLQVVGLCEDAPVVLEEVDLKLPTALVIGSEGDGITAECKNECNVLASIPMQGRTKALNASVAAGIAIYELFRQRIVRKATL